MKLSGRTGVDVKKSHHISDHVVGRVLHHPVAGVFKAVYFGVREVFQKSIEERRRKTPIAHSPDQLNRQVCQSSQPLLNIDERRIAGVTRGHRNIFHEPLDRHTVRPTVVRRSNPRASWAVAAPGCSIAIESAARTNAFAPRTASTPKTGVRQTRIRHGIRSDRNAAVFNSTNRENRSGIRTAAPRPIAPPQSWATSVTSLRSSRSMSEHKSSMRRAKR